MLTRTTKIGWKFERVGLDQKEMDEAMDKLLRHNMKELDRISKLLVENKFSDSDKALFFPILAEKQLVSSFTVLANGVDEKIFELKQKKEKRWTKEEDKNIKQKVEEGLKKKDTPEGQSMIDKAFDEAEMTENES